ncbi:MAG: hypothetical protein ACOCZ2_01565 [Thermodesulfobacteriota bacterium]
MNFESIWSIVSRLSNRGSLEVDAIVSEVMEKFESESGSCENWTTSSEYANS